MECSFPATTITLSMDMFICLVGALVLLDRENSTLNDNSKGLPALVSYPLIVLFTVLGMCGLILISELVPMFLSIELQSFAVYIFDFIIFNFTVSCEEVDALPRIMEFKDLHLTESLKEVKETLQDQSGVYCMLCEETGAMYIGSSCDMGPRLMCHVFNWSSNLHLQRAIALYGLSTFTFIVVEFCKPSDLVAREQYWLNWLFLLPPSFRFNFNPIAYFPPSWLGKKREAQSGSNHHNYGKLAFNASGVSVLNLEGALVATFPSRMAAAKWLGISQPSVSLAIKRRSIVKSFES